MTDHIAPAMDAASESEYLRIAALTETRIALALLQSIGPLDGENATDLKVAAQAIDRIRSRLYRE